MAGLPGYLGLIPLLALGACSSDDDRPQTVGMLEGVARVEAQRRCNVFFDALCAGMDRCPTSINAGAGCRQNQDICVGAISVTDTYQECAAALDQLACVDVTTPLPDDCGDFRLYVR